MVIFKFPYSLQAPEIFQEAQKGNISIDSSTLSLPDLPTQISSINMMPSSLSFLGSNWSLLVSWLKPNWKILSTEELTVSVLTDKSTEKSSLSRKKRPCGLGAGGGGRTWVVELQFDDSDAFLKPGYAFYIQVLQEGSGLIC